MKRSSVLLSTISVLLLFMIACLSATSTAAPAPVVTEEVIVPVTGATPTTPVLTEAPTIQHQNIPGELPLERAGYVGDQDSSTTAEQNRAPGGDRFTFNRFERPFNAESMDVYFPYLDILESSIYQDETWVFAVIKLKGQSEQGSLPGKYAMELDMDLDGGGDWLVLVDAPASAEWSVSGVKVWFDENNDVGGTDTMYTDNPPTTGNGYEKLVFDQGVGDDPDTTWTRISPIDPASIQFAIKRSLFAGDTSFMANAWAGTGDLDPALFDLSDSFTHDRAGTSLVELPIFYPIKELSELDNACRMPVGFAATGNEPGLCPIAPVQPEQPTGCQGQTVCFIFGNQTVCYCIEN